MRPPDRIYYRFQQRVPVGPVHACWIWPMSVGSHGYGQIGWGGPVGDRGTALAHRLAWEVAFGPIPEGLTVDHMCRERRCVNPSHLRLLPNAVNAASNGFSSKTHCAQGHPYDEINTARYGPRRVCITCRRAAWHRHVARR